MPAARSSRLKRGQIFPVSVSATPGAMENSLKRRPRIWARQHLMATQSGLPAAFSTAALIPPQERLWSSNLGSHKYSVHELPEIGSLSGTAILADGNNIWLGLQGRPEVEGTNPRLLRYNKSSGTVQKYAVNDVINTINRMGDTIYCGTSDGLYTIRGVVASAITALSRTRPASW